ncbi:hypothetical protein SLEP1_g51484 [Rubroshorea leprosula]|uniref:ATPase AAA-type core domain-containing protein n=1 Tax=Rubroshorea leprosula TaxID=152421 RepID=A0AAV5M6Z8_9ROSI|nr:hypothetical protein SLEP1_g51484 [Rubroshorea leprosula]
MSMEFEVMHVAGIQDCFVRDIFSKAAAAAPCLLFFDEFDSIAPKRRHDNTGVTDRVVNQVVDQIYLMRHCWDQGGLIGFSFVIFHLKHERLDILTVLSRKLPLVGDVDLDTIANMTEGFGGADLQALLSGAQLAVVHKHLNRKNSNETGKLLLITDALLKSTASKARPSVSESEKQRLYGIYSQFLDSKRFVAARTLFLLSCLSLMKLKWNSFLKAVDQIYLMRHCWDQGGLIGFSFVIFHLKHERLDILTVLSRKLPLVGDVDLDTIANMTEGFGGADLQALLSGAQLTVVHEHLNRKNSNETGKLLLITDALLKSTASKARPSVSESEKQRLYGIYSQFLDSKRFVAARDAKGKQATLA